MTRTTDPDARRRAEVRAEVRAVARRLHPDLGGDPAAYLAALAELDGRRGRPGLAAPSAAAAAAAGPRGDASPVARARRLLRRHLRGALPGARARLPRRVPGARRWARL